VEKQGFNNDTLSKGTINNDVHKRSAIEDHNFKVLFDYAPQGMMTVDKDYKIVNINTTAAQIFSVSAEQSIGKTIGGSFGCVNFNKKVGTCNGSEACSFCVFKNSVDNVLFNGGRVNGIEFPFDCRAAEEDYQCWLKLTAVPMMLNNALHALLVIDDVTVNKELAKNLIRNEKRLRLVMDNMIDMITQINHKGEIEFVTSSCWSMLGYSPDELINKIFTDYVFQEDLLMVKSLFQKRFKTRENFSTRLRLLNRAQEVVWVEANGSVVDDENRRRTIVYVIRDVTEEERYKRELEKSKEAAISASKSKSEFLANMSHEIRTPMNGIIGMTNITLMDRLTKEQRENLIMVKNSAISLLGIINSILDFSKIEAGKIEIEKVEFDIKDLVSKTVNPLIISADQKGIELEVNYDLHMHRKLIGDPVRISQIMNNIIYNAIKFTKKGGSDI
jgi:PAS domain S-box-containing protein